MENTIEQTLNSIEVAEMVDKEHSKLLRDIRRYEKQFAEAKIGLGDFFKESIYKDANNQDRPCYRITKKGCEFIAHKLTGVKGTIFTARYINRFREMEIQLAAGINMELVNYLKEMLEKQNVVLCDIKRQTKRQGYLYGRKIRTVQDEHKQEIEEMIERSNDTEYLCAVYTFAKHYPNRSIKA